MPPLSIVHLTTFLQGGAGRAIVDLACAQHRAGHEVLVACSRTGDAGYGNYPQYLDQLAHAGVPLLLADSFFKRDAALNRQALDALRARRPASGVDLVHAHAATPARIALGYVEAATRPVPVLQTQHGWGINKTPEQARDDLAVLAAMDRVVVTSDATAGWLASQGVPAGQVTTIPCGLPVDTPAAPASARRALAPWRARDRFVVGCIGSVTSNKNQRALVEALAHTAPDVVAIFVGEGGEGLLDQARACGVSDRVLAVGYQPQADGWMRLLDVLAVPSLTEGQGLVVLEAFRAGVPVVAADIPPLRHLVTPRRTGWLFNPRDPASLASTIEDVRLSPPAQRAALLRAARRVFRHGYTTGDMVDAHESLYAAVCTGRRDPRDPVRCLAGVLQSAFT